MQHTCNISASGVDTVAHLRCGTVRSGYRCDRFLLLALALTLSRIVDAAATDDFFLSGSAVRPNSGLGMQRTPVGAPLPIAPLSFSLTDMPAPPTFSEQDFRPRGHSIFEHPVPTGTADDTPMLRGSTVWQRLADFRSHGRVRLLTLWENGGSSVSLQAGKKGEPSLQWTSRSMNRGGATRGVLDQLMSVSVAGASRGLHMAPHPISPATPEPGGHAIKTSESSLGANK